MSGTFGDQLRDSRRADDCRGLSHAISFDGAPVNGFGSVARAKPTTGSQVARATASAEMAIDVRLDRMSTSEPLMWSARKTASL